MDVDAVIARDPELALVDELAHTNLAHARNAKRYEDIDEILEAGIAVTSTVNIQHLESLNDEVFELTGVRVRETFPDRILDEADEVVLVDLAPEALRDRLRAGKVYPSERVETALDNFFRLDNLAALRELVLRELAEDVEARRTTAVLDPLSQQAVAERILVLVTPEPRSQRILRRAFRSGQRLGSEIDAVWVRRPGQRLDEAETVALAALRRLASILGAHFIEVEGTSLPETVKRVVAERGSTYVFLGTPDESRRTRDPARLARVEARARPAGHRHPGRRRPGAARGGRAVTFALIAALVALAAALAVIGFRLRRPGRPSAPVERILVPFTGGGLDPTVLAAGIRIARAEDATLVPAYLIVVPLEQAQEVPMQQQVTMAMPLLEAVEHAALRAGVPVDARVESGRTPIHALSASGRPSISIGSSCPPPLAATAASHRRTSRGC